MNSQKKNLISLFILIVFIFFTSVSGYPEESVIWYNQGNMILNNVSYLKQNHTQIQSALTAYERSIEIAPDYYEAWNQKADALNRMGNYREALEASNRSLAINITYVQGWINRGEILYMLGYEYENKYNDQKNADILYTEQLSAFEKATTLDPDNAVAWFNKGFAFGGMNRYDEAIAAFDKVNSLDPTYPHLDYYRNLAEKNRDASTPFYIRNAFTIAVIIICIIGAAAWFIAVRKKY